MTSPFLSVFFILKKSKTLYVVCVCARAGNKAAGVRARKSLQDLKLLAQELRIAIQRCKSENAQARLVDWGNTDFAHTPSHGLAVMNVDGLMAPALSPVPALQTPAFTDELMPAAGAVRMPLGIPSIQIQSEAEGMTQENVVSTLPAPHPSL